MGKYQVQSSATPQNYFVCVCVCVSGESAREAASGLQKQALQRHSTASITEVTPKKKKKKDVTYAQK